MDLSLLLTKKRVIIALCFAGLGILVIIVASILLRTPVDSIYLHDSGVTIKHDVVGSETDGSYLLNTSRNFVDYDPETGATKLLMNDGALPDISNIRWSPDHKRAIFASNNPDNKQDVLSNIAASLGLSTTSQVWWIADFTNKTYIPLGQSTIHAGWVDNSNIFMVGLPAIGYNFGLYTAETSTRKFTSLYEDTSLLNAYSTGDGFMIYSVKSGAGTLSQVANGKTTPVFKGLSRAPLVNNRGTSAVIFVNNSKTIPDEADLSDDNAQLIDIGSGKVIKTLTKQEGSDGYWSAKGDSYYYPDSKNSKIVKFLVQGASVDVSYLGLRNAPKLLQGKMIVNGKNDIVIFDTTNHLYFGSPDKKKKVHTYNPRPATDPNGMEGGGFHIFYYPQTNYYGLSITDTDFGGAQQRAFETLRRAGANPDLLDYEYEFENNYTQPPVQTFAPPAKEYNGEQST